MPFVENQYSSKEIGAEPKVETSITVTEPLPEDNMALLERIMILIKYYNLSRLEITKDSIHYTHHPDRKVEETQLIDWYINTR